MTTKKKVGMKMNSISTIVLIASIATLTALAVMALSDAKDRMIKVTGATVNLLFTVYLIAVVYTTQLPLANEAIILQWVLVAAYSLNAIILIARKICTTRFALISSFIAGFGFLIPVVAHYMCQG